MSSRKILGVALLATASMGCFRPDVVRVYEGVPERERFISPSAYAAYAIGAEEEARGRHLEALNAFEQAARHDSESADVWTRIASLRCRLGRPAAAQDALARAEKSDPLYAPAWRVRALCAERRGDLASAVAHARRAVELAPSDDENVLRYARLLGEAGEPRQAWSWLVALTIRSPASLRVWQAVHDHAHRVGDRAWEHHASRRLVALRERFASVDADEPDEREAAPWVEVDDALLAEDLPLARRQLRGARLDTRLLAARAIAVGKPSLAREEAALRLGADPSDADARAALALATDLLGDSEAAGAILGGAPANGDGLSGVGRLLLGELLMRHVGPAAATAVVSGVAPGGKGPRAQLRDLLRKRLAQTRGGP